MAKPTIVEALFLSASSLTRYVASWWSVDQLDNYDAAALIIEERTVCSFASRGFPRGNGAPHGLMPPDAPLHQRHSSEGAGSKSSLPQANSISTAPAAPAQFTWAPEYFTIGVHLFTSLAIKALKASGVEPWTMKPCAAKVVLDVRRLQHFVHFRAQLFDHLRRRASRRKQALP